MGPPVCLSGSVEVSPPRPAHGGLLGNRMLLGLLRQNAGRSCCRDVSPFILSLSDRRKAQEKPTLRSQREATTPGTRPGPTG